VARVLFELVSRAPLGPEHAQLRELLMRQAARIAINRTVAGVHYPADSMAGQALGFAVAEYFIQRCTAGAANNVASLTFDGAAYPGNQDFTGNEFYNPTTDAFMNPAPPYYARVAGAITVRQSLPLNWLWRQASNEW